MQHAKYNSIQFFYCQLRRLLPAVQSSEKYIHKKKETL